MKEVEEDAVLLITGITIGFIIGAAATVVE
jgi:gas vesicle protein